MNNEAIKTKIDEDEEVKRYTTFLQKPNRSSSKDLCSINQGEQLQYQKNFCGTIKTTHQPIDSSQTDEVKPNSCCEMTTKDITDTDVPELLECKTHEDVGESIILNNITPVLLKPITDNELDEKFDQCSNFTKPVEINDDEKLMPSKLSLEKQLGEIQSQLRELSHLPSTLGNVLDDITKQISEILKLQDENSDNPSAISLHSEASNGDINTTTFEKKPYNMDDNNNNGNEESSINVENTSESSLLTISEEKGILIKKYECESEHEHESEQVKV